MDETCIIQKWISKRVYLFRMFGESRPTYGGVKVQESRMRENFMYGLRRGQGKRSDGRLERDTRLKEEKHLGSHDLYTTAPLSYSTTGAPVLSPIRPEADETNRCQPAAFMEETNQRY